MAVGSPSSAACCNCRTYLRLLATLGSRSVEPCGLAIKVFSYSVHSVIPTLLPVGIAPVPRWRRMVSTLRKVSVSDLIRRAASRFESSGYLVSRNSFQMCISSSDTACLRRRSNCSALKNRDSNIDNASSRVPLRIFWNWCFSEWDKLNVRSRSAPQAASRERSRSTGNHALQSRYVQTLPQ